MHHILTGFMDEAPKNGQPAFENKWGASVGSYAVGAESEVAPTDAGTYIPPGGAIGFQNHYTPYGKEVVTHSKIGLYFYKPGEVPDIVMHNNQIVNNAIVLPPYDGHHEENRLHGVSEGRAALFGVPARPLPRDVFGPVDPLSGRQGKSFC